MPIHSGNKGIAHSYFPDFSNDSSRGLRRTAAFIALVVLGALASGSALILYVSLMFALVILMAALSYIYLPSQPTEEAVRVENNLPAPKEEDSSPKLVNLQKMEKRRAAIFKKSLEQKTEEKEQVDKRLTEPRKSHLLYSHSLFKKSSEQKTEEKEQVDKRPTEPRKSRLLYSPSLKTLFKKAQLEGKRKLAGP